MSTLKKVLLALGITILLLVLTGAMAIYLNASAGRRAAVRKETAQRAQRKIHIGDSQQIVRLRIGMPDSIIRQPPPYQYEVAWTYKAVGIEFAAIVFDSAKQVDRIFTVGDYLWAPEDALSARLHDDPDLTIQSFKDKLGAPCDTSYADGDSSWVRFYYPLAASELRADSAYRALNEKGVATLRFLEVNLRSGKKVMYHGWARGWCGPKPKS